MKFFYYLINIFAIIIVSFFISFFIEKKKFKVIESKIIEPSVIIEEKITKQDSLPILEPKLKQDPIIDKEITKLPLNNCANGSEILLVDILINSQVINEVSRIERLTNGNFILSEQVWKELNLIPKGEKIKMSDCSEGYLLDAKLGFSFKYDEEKFTFDILAPVDAFQLSTFSKKKSLTHSVTPSSSGAYANYNISGTTSSNSSNFYGGVFDLNGFNKIGSLSNSLIAKKNQTEQDVIRTDTFFQKDFPNTMQTLTVGDTISSSGDWSRPARYTGIKWARNFATQPGYIYTPSNILSGSAALPSVVDVYINNQKYYSEKITPGAFNFTNLPIPSGAGEVNLLVKDLLGNERVISQNFYQSQKLVAENETDFSLESGFLRQDYGSKSNSYQGLFGSGTYLQGITNSLTTRGRLEVQQQRQALGADISSSIGNFALIRTGVATSNDHDVGTGSQYNLALEHINNKFSSHIERKYYYNNYRAFAAQSNETRPKETLTAGFGFPIYTYTSLSINYLSQSNWNMDRFSSTTLSSGVKLPYGLNLSLYANKRMDKSQDWSSGLSLSMPLGEDNKYFASANSSATAGRDTINTYRLTQQAPSGPGFGWSIQNEDLKNNNQANITLNTNASQYSLDLQETSNFNATRLGVNGSLGWLEGKNFFSRNIGGDSFAVVKVGDLKDVQIYNQNQVVALTNSKGEAVIRLRPYDKAKIEIKEEELPLDIEYTAAEMQLVPYARSGLFVDFPVTRSFNALITLELKDGTFVPIGAEVIINDQKEKFVVGKRGEVYIKNLSATNRIIAVWDSNKCEFDLSIDLKQTNEQNIGPIKCLN